MITKIRFTQAPSEDPIKETVINPDDEKPKVWCFIQFEQKCEAGNKLLTAIGEGTALASAFCSAINDMKFLHELY